MTGRTSTADPSPGSDHRNEYQNTANRIKPVHAAAIGEEALAGESVVLALAANEDFGWMTDADALRVLDVAVSEVQTDNQQQSQRERAQWIREWIQERLRSEDIPAEPVPLVSDEDIILNGSGIEQSVDALQLTYQNLLESDVPPRDFDTHLLVLHTLRTEATNIRTHRLAAIVQSVVLKSCKDDPSKWPQLSRIFDDDAWFHSVIGLDKNEPMERESAQQIYDCGYVGMLTTFLEQCTASSPDQTEHDRDLDTLRVVLSTVVDISSAIPTELQHQFVDVASVFIRKYPEDCLGHEDGLCSVLYRAVHEYDGWIKDWDALRILDAAVYDQQESHQGYARKICGQMQNRLRPENIPADSVPLVSDGE
ncbi:unnamed protein product [Mycena citricolor]|uniref:Uncharacterized protein n=1 Tax=Mycena citricolor TaxID=2018698 RepID=A0AAD2JUZ8_9AGAR|nr:unnamed protein product [Mycena citricolor]